MRQHTLIGLLMASLLAPAAAHADERADFLQKAYLSFCVKHLDNYAGLRQQLIEQQLPKLPPQQAGHFLQQQAGDAWPLPYQGQFGHFVLVLPEGDLACSVMARSGDSTEIRRWFVSLAEQAPAPLLATALDDASVDTPLSGPASQLSWQWATEHAPRRLVLSLTTAEKPDAPIQAKASLALTER